MARKTILLADRNRHVRTVIQSRFATNGYQIIEAENGLNALHRASGLKVDVLILGDELPGEQVTVLREIRKEFDAPIIILSSQSREQFRSIVTQLSEVYYLSKPLDLRKLASLLSSLIGPGTQPAASPMAELHVDNVQVRQSATRTAPAMFSH